MITAAALALLCHWGASEVLGQPTSLGVDLTIQNKLTRNVPQKTACRVTVDGVALVVIWNHVPNAPDVIQVITPIDYYAEPEVVVVPEDGSAVIHVLMKGMS